MRPSPPKVAAVFEAMPARARARLNEIRRVIFAAAKASEVGEIVETLKWGQPAYLPLTPRVGTTLRLGWSPSDPDHVALYVHCQTRLLDQYRERFPSEFQYDGNRAVRVPATGPFAKTALQQIAAMALTYHRDKKGRT